MLPRLASVPMSNQLSFRPRLDAPTKRLVHWLTCFTNWVIVWNTSGIEHVQYDAGGYHCCLEAGKDHCYVILQVAETGSSARAAAPCFCHLKMEVDDTDATTRPEAADIPCYLQNRGSRRHASLPQIIAHYRTGHRPTSFRPAT